MNCYVYPWENQNWDRQSAKTMKAGLLLLLINRFFFHVRKKKLWELSNLMWKGCVKQQLTFPMKKFPMKNYADQKMRLPYCCLITEHSFKQIKH